MRRLWPVILVALVAQASAETAPSGAASCSGCHGEGAEAAFPIDHLTAEEIAAAMAAFRSGEREATLMNRIARGFSEAESAAIAAWIARER